jgi:hypothetical protein
MMRRTQIQLTDVQIAKLRELAIAQGRSVADLIRESVDRYVQNELPVDREELKRRALAVVGRYRSGKRDIAVNHDRYLAEAYRR